MNLRSYEMTYESEEVHILRDRLREYKNLLTLLYHFIDSASLGKDDRETAQKILATLDKHGVGDTEARPILDKGD